MTLAGWHVLLMTVLVIGTAGPASADPELGLSVDGASWTSDLTVALFDPDIRWVPGDTRSATFQVRNHSGDPAVLTVDVFSTEAHTLLDNGDLTISASGGGGAWRDVSTPGTHRLVSLVGIRPGASSPGDIVVAVSPAATNQSMRRDLDLRFRVRLTQGSVAVGPRAEDLPGTGGPPAWVLLLGVTMTTAGIALTSRNTQKEVAHV
jgi:hypothetical protein